MKRLLIIEDDKDALDMAVFTFENNGFEVTKGGKDISTGDVIALKPHIIVIGFQLKGLTGNDVCQRLKADDKCNPIPVIVYSTILETAKITKGNCADGYLGKPLELDDLIWLAHRIALS
ncbi:MAG: PleD family two-component system response regulator [Sphingobacteriales bacterium]